MRNRYRIVTGCGYNGCFPITVYWVQVYKDTYFGGKWNNIEGFDTYSAAKNLLQSLQ